MDEIHRKVLEVLNIPTHVMQGYSREMDGRVVKKASHVVTMPIPSLDALTPPLMGAMVTSRYSVESFQNDVGLGAGLRDWSSYEVSRGWVIKVSPYETIPHAIAALFLAAVEARLIDPTTVRL